MIEASRVVAANSFTLGIRALGQTWLQCMAANANTYSEGAVLQLSRREIPPESQSRGGVRLRTSAFDRHGESSVRFGSAVVCCQRGCRLVHYSHLRLRRYDHMRNYLRERREHWIQSPHRSLILTASAVFSVVAVVLNAFRFRYAHGDDRCWAAVAVAVILFAWLKYGYDKLST